MNPNIIEIEARHAHDWLIRKGWKLNEQLSHPTEPRYIAPDGCTGTHVDLAFAATQQMLMDREESQ